MGERGTDVGSCHSLDWWRMLCHPLLRCAFLSLSIPGTVMLVHFPDSVLGSDNQEGPKQIPFANASISKCKHFCGQEALAEHGKLHKHATQSQWRAAGMSASRCTYYHMDLLHLVQVFSAAPLNAAGKWEAKRPNRWTSQHHCILLPFGGKAVVPSA